MLPLHNPLTPGDPVFHPKYGFGAIHGLTRRSRIEPIRELSGANDESEHTEDYYDIHLAEGGTLLVPVSRAESVGLRRLSGGVEAVKACLRSPALSLPEGSRERLAALKMREHLVEPDALAHSVRDMLAQGRGRAFSTSEKTWLEKSCQRLSIEAALVDGISVYEARAAIMEIVRQISGS